MSALTVPQLRLSEIETLRLFETLESLLQRHQNLLSLLQDEKRLIVEGKIEALLSCVGKKEVLMKQIAGLEEERLSLLEGVDTSNKASTLKILLFHVAPAYREKLKILGGQLDILTASITEINQMNGILVERVLGQISDLFTLLRHLTSDGDTYQDSGKMRNVMGGRTISRG